jgi:DNA-binding GntR family transcriptional regulator
MVVSNAGGLEITEHENGQPIHRWVYQILRANIIKLSLKPASQISENEISDALQTSRTPVREAFIRLAEDGLLRITPQKKTVVSPINLQQADEARFVRRAIEKAVIMEACGNLQDADLAALKTSIDGLVMCRKTKAHDGMLIFDNDFHLVIFKACGKERSWLYIQRLDYNYDRLRTMTMPNVIDDVIGEHRKILDAIAKGRVESIDALVDNHMSLKAINQVIRGYPPEYFEGNFESAEASSPWIGDGRVDEGEGKGGVTNIKTGVFEH